MNGVKEGQVTPTPRVCVLLVLATALLAGGGGRRTTAAVPWTDADIVNSCGGSVNNTAPCVEYAGGKWLVVWSAKATSAPADWSYGNDADIFFSRSDGMGGIWSPQVPVNPDTGSDSLDDTDPQIAADDAGHCVVMWQSGPSVTISTSSDFGTTWSQTAVLGEGAPGSVTTDRLGRWVAVWNFGRNVCGSWSLDNGRTWATPSVVAEGESAYVPPYILVRTLSFKGARVSTDRAGVWLTPLDYAWVMIYVDQSWEVWRGADSRFSLDGGVSWSGGGHRPRRSQGLPATTSSDC